MFGLLWIQASAGFWSEILKFLVENVGSGGTVLVLGLLGVLLWNNKTLWKVIAEKQGEIERTVEDRNFHRDFIFRELGKELASSNDMKYDLDSQDLRDDSPKLKRGKGKSKQR